ncbi:hypothetical protein HN747_02040 [archaeon]|nr:hypothetical protein [archaeon]
MTLELLADDMPSFDMESKYLSGPLRELRGESFIIKDYYGIPCVNVGYIGVTRAGKNQSIRDLVYTLGGMYQEINEDSDHIVVGKSPVKNRSPTQKDSSNLFAEFYQDNRKWIGRINLKSHAGHRVEADKGPGAEYSIVVIKNVRSDTISRQIRKIEPILNHEEILRMDSPVLLTRTTCIGDLPIHRNKQLKNGGFGRVFVVDNKPKMNYPLSSFQVANAEILLHSMEHSSKNPIEQCKLIYFGKEAIPAYLEHLIVPFDGQLEIKDAISESAEIEISSEERMLRAIFGTPGKETFV